MCDCSFCVNPSTLRLNSIKTTPRGYTSNVDTAWKVPWETAKHYITCAAYDDRVVAEPAPVPEYCRDLNAMREAMLAMPQAFRDAVNNVLMEMMRPSEAWVLDRTINASALDRAVAFVAELQRVKDGKNT